MQRFVSPIVSKCNKNVSDTRLTLRQVEMLIRSGFVCKRVSKLFRNRVRGTEDRISVSRLSVKISRYRKSLAVKNLIATYPAGTKVSPQGHNCIIIATYSILSYSFLLLLWLYVIVVDIIGNFVGMDILGAIFGI